MTGNVVSAYELMDRFRESYPDLSSAAKILSKYPMAQGGEEIFVRDYASKLAGGTREARQIYRTAYNINEKAALIWANVKDAISPYYNQTLFNNIPEDFLDHLQFLPNYDRLFGSLDYVSCEQCRSIFGPSAYFADLMRFVDTYISRGKDAARDTVFPEDCTLRDRRPDLYKMRLDCSNSIDLIPQIDLVNELLEGFVISEYGTDAYNAARKAIFPQSLPFNLPLEEIRSFLKRYDTSLHQIYSIFARPFEFHPFDEKESQQKSIINREFLELSLIDQSLIISEIPSEDVSSFYGDVPIKGINGLENVDVFLEQTRLTRTELNELLFLGLNRHEINAGQSRLFFINRAYDGLGPLTLSMDEGDSYERLVNLSSEKLERMYRFLKLSRKLGWSFADLDWSLRSLYEPYVPEKVLKFDGINDYVQCSAHNFLNLPSPRGLTIEAWISPDSSGRNAIVGLLADIQGDKRHILLEVDPFDKLVFRIRKQNSTSHDFENEFEIVSNSSIPLGEFTHIALTAEKLTAEDCRVRLCINGRIDVENVWKIPSIGVYTNISIDMNIGRDLFDEYFDGCIKDLRIWSIARDPADIEEDRYLRFAGPVCNLTGYWPLVEADLFDQTFQGTPGILGGEGFISQPKWVYRDLILDPVSSSHLQFNGIDQYMAAKGVDIAETTEFSLEAWVKIDDEQIDDEQDSCIVCLGNESGFRIAMLVNASGNLAIQLNAGSSETPIACESNDPIPKNGLIHLCAVLKEETEQNQRLEIYLGGCLKSSHTVSPKISVELDNGEVNVGRSFDGHYFRGGIKELRMWRVARTEEQIALYISRRASSEDSGLIGYWRLDEVEEGMARDMSSNRNDLYLGGLQADYMPTPVATEVLPEAFPDQINGTVLQFDGYSDAIAIKNAKNWGLGRYERLTVELWFKASRVEDSSGSSRKQVIFTQGDIEAGLNIYLEGELLHVLEWNNSLEGDLLHKSISKAQITYDAWHHVALTHNEFSHKEPADGSIPVEDDIEFRVYLDGVPVDSSARPGYRLSPVGTAYLGGLGKRGVTRFEDDYSQPDSEHLYFFTGQVADLRIWNSVKSPEEIGDIHHRRHAPQITDDLVNYMPLNEGSGGIVFGWPKEPEEMQYKGTSLQDVALVTSKVDPRLINIYSHYIDPEKTVLDWKNYYFSGRMRITDRNAAVGVTFLSRHPEGVDQCYILGRDNDHPGFRLFAHPSGVQTLEAAEQSEANESNIESNIIPQLNLWYSFLIEIQADSGMTSIRAKVWPEETPEPAEFCLEAIDKSDIHITQGTVGLWSSGSSDGERQFDNLRVWPASIANPSSSDFLLNVNFEGKSQPPEPDNWLDTEESLELVAAGGLFKEIAVAGEAEARTAFGTESDNTNIYSYYNPSESTINPLTWNNYIYRGRMRISDPNGGIGITLLSRQPAGVGQYYAIQRDAEQHNFRLLAYPKGVQNVSGEVDSGVNPVANAWYHFLIIVENSDDSTRIRAKIWEEGKNMPDEPQIDAIDGSCVHIKSGTVGIWASGSGSKYFDSLKVEGLRLFEGFGSCSEEEDPSNWRDTAYRYSNIEDNSLFKVFELEGNKVFGTRSNLDFIHSHYIAKDALSWSKYVYTGRMRLDDDSKKDSAGIGVTFLSNYFQDRGDYNRYYRLISKDYRNFYAESITGEGSLNGPAHTGVIPALNKWYRFKIEVEDGGTRTNIRAKIWLESNPEPSDYKINAYDNSDRRLKSGTIGVVTMGMGSKYFDDLEVVGEMFLSPSSLPEEWTDVGTRLYQKDDTLFGTVAYIGTDANDVLHWVDIDDYPVLLRPLSRRAMHFDGLQQYLASELSLHLGEFTLEAWISLSEIRESPILSLSGVLNGTNATLVFGTDDQGHLQLCQIPGRQLVFHSEDPLPLNKFVHVAVSVQPGNVPESPVTFFVDGIVKGTSVNLTDSIHLVVDRGDIGRDGEGHHFGGTIKEVRIWNCALERNEIASQMYQQPPDGSPGLVGYWSLGEDGGDTVEDLSPGKNPMRAGGLVEDRRPISIDSDFSYDGFLQPDRKVLDFNGDQMILLTDEGSRAIRRRRTVEIWFRVEDKCISSHKQVIYQEGDANCGLIIYVYSSALYFGGYNIDESQWQGTWLHTDRIESGKWHHCALVLDGRAEVRDESFQCFLDGKIVDAGPGSQIWGQGNIFSLGGIREATRFHDGISSAASGNHFRGQILRLRIWDSALTASEIQGSLYERYSAVESLAKSEPDMHWEFDVVNEMWDPDISKGTDRIIRAPMIRDGNLQLWWEFDHITDLSINDLSGKGHTASFAVGQLQTILLPGAYRLPEISLDADSLDGIAAIKRLKEAYDQPIDRLTALWYGINHQGKDGKTPLFDRVFNPKGSVIEHWACYMDEPMRWDKTGAEDRKRDGQIRSRLMGALRVSHEDLNAIADRISGSDENIIYIDSTCLWRMYQIASLARTLQLSVRDLIRILSVLSKDSVDSLQDVVEISKIAEWINGTGLNASDLAYLIHDPADLEGIDVSLFTEDDINSMAANLVGRSSDVLINNGSFISDYTSQARSSDIFRLLYQPLGLITGIGAVTAKYVEDYDLEDLLSALAGPDKENWIKEFDPLKAELDQAKAGLGNDIIQRLQSHGFIDGNGLVLDNPNSVPDKPPYCKDNLIVIFDGQTPDAITINKLSRVTELLEKRKAFQDQIIRAVHDALKKSRDDFYKSIKPGILINNGSFVSDLISQDQSSDIFSLLYQPFGLITGIGAVTAKYAEGYNLEDLLSALAGPEKENWIKEFDPLKSELNQARAGLDDIIINWLISSGFIGGNGLVLKEPDEDSLKAIFVGQALDAGTVDTLSSSVLEVLKRRKYLQDHIVSDTGPVHTALKVSMHDLSEAVYSELSSIFGVRASMISVIFDYLKISDGLGISLDASLFIEKMIELGKMESSPSEIKGYLFKMSKLVYIADAFELTDAETAQLLSDPGRFSISNPLQPTLWDLDNLSQFKHLQLAFEDSEGKLIVLLGMEDAAEIESALDDLTGWEPREVRSLVAHFGASRYNTIPGLGHLRECFELAGSMKAGVDLLLQLADTSSLGTENEHDFYSRQSTVLLEVLRAGYTDEEWPAVYDQIHGEMAEKRRDALLDLALERLPKYWMEYLFSPDLFNPNIFSIDIFSPDLFNPNIFSIDIFSPDLFSPDNIPGPDDEKLRIFLGRHLKLNWADGASITRLGSVIRASDKDTGENWAEIALGDTKATLTTNGGLALDLEYGLDFLYEKLRIFLGRHLKLNWADGASITRLGSIIRASDKDTGENWAEIALGDTKATLTTNGGLALGLEYGLDFLFCWDDITAGNDAELNDFPALKAFLKNDLGLEWVEGASISREDDVVTLQGTSPMRITITLTKTPDSNEDMVTLGTNDPYTYYLKARRMGEKWNIYLTKIYQQNRFRKGPDIYQEYFLMDMQVGREVDTSRIVQGTAALQYYIQRCLMNLEPGVDPSSIPQQEWEWVKNYRVWEANRKVFLYPENYIEPELRDSKTPFFKDLEQELLQSDINQESVQTAYVHYLDKFAEVAGLKMVGSYLHADLESYDPSNTNSLKKTLYLVGKTATEPGMFYLREWISDEMGERWLPWKKIDLVINSEFVTPVYAFGKLFLFWAEFIKLKKGTGNQENPGETRDVFKATVKYSYYNLSKQWTQPQSYEELDRELSYAEHDQLRWQRLNAQRIADLKSLPDSGSAQTEEKNARVLQIDELTRIKKNVPDFDMSSMTWEFWARFINNRPEGWPETTPPSGSNEADCYLRSSTLIDYGNGGGFKVRTVHRVAMIPDYESKTNASKYVASQTNLALTYFNSSNKSEGYDSAATCYSSLLANDNLNVEFENHAEIRDLIETAKDSVDNWKQKAASDSETARDNAWSSAQNAAVAADTAATAAKNSELAKPKWESKKVILSFEVAEQIPIEHEVDYGIWQHIAVTLQLVQVQGYSFELYVNGEEVKSETSLGTSLLTKGKPLTIGVQGADVRDAFTVQMSEFRLWNHLRSNADIRTGMRRRLKGSQGLNLCLPLNAIESSSMMTLVPSELNFSLPAIKAMLPRIAGRERLILFYGDRVASLRNNLKDKSFRLVLESKMDKLVSDVRLSTVMTSEGDSGKDILHLVEEMGLDIDDYATGLERDVDGSVLIPITFSDTRYLLRNLEGRECSLMDVNNQPGWYILDTGDDDFLAKMVISPNGTPQRIPTTSEIMNVEYVVSAGKESLQEISVSFNLKDDNPLAPQSYLPLKAMEVAYKDLKGITITPDGRKALLTYLVYNSGRIEEWDLSERTEPRDISIETKAGCQSLKIAITPDARTMVIARAFKIKHPYKPIFSFYETLTLRDLGSVQETKPLSRNLGRQEQHLLLALSDDGRKAISVSMYRISVQDSEYRITVWDFVSNIVTDLPWPGVAGKIRALRMVQNKCIALADDRGLIVWNLDDLISEPKIYPGHSNKDGIEVMDVSADGRIAVTVQNRQTLRVWDLNTENIRDLDGHTDSITAVVIFMTSKGHRALSVSLDKTLILWDLDNHALLRVLSCNEQSTSFIDVTSDGSIAITISTDGELKVWDLNADPIQLKFERLNTYAVHQLKENLFVGGIDKLLSIESQKSKELDFWAEYEPNDAYVTRSLNSIPSTIDFKGAQRLYFEEIFFHLPFLIANSLNSNQKFEEAQRWYHYIFNPTADEEGGAQVRDKNRYWRYLPFRDDSFQSLKTLLTDEEALAAYREDPFDPHAIAALRMTAYKKAVVMKYIDNLLDWGDFLFMEDTRESINEALGLYLIAYDLLGPRPKAKTVKRFEDIGTFEDFIENYLEGSEFLTSVEKIAPGAGGAVVLNPHSSIITDFCVPENEKFIGYWDLVEDRLYKIRHSMNFEGTSRQLSLFAPPIEPSDLVRSVAAGSGVSGALADLNVAVPHYRYPFVAALAKEMASNVISLGASLLDALEKKDAEQLAMLQNSHERVILNLMTSIKENEINLAKKAKEALEESKKSPEYKIAFYGEKFNENLNPEEIAELVLIGSAQLSKSTAVIAKGISTASYAVPDTIFGVAGISSPVQLLQTGGKSAGEVSGAIAEVAEFIADILNTSANMTGKMGGYKRRRAGWEFEKNLAEKEIVEIDKQIEGAKIQIAIANQGLVAHSKMIQQNQEIERFYRSKFSSESLYNWMAGRLSSLYFQAYKTAYDLAKSAEKAMQYEIPSTESYITPIHWDGLKKGLLAGESLMLQIDQMEKSHLAQDSRFQEIQKTISMKNTFPGSLLLLMAKGACEFQLKEELFDRDYPGHYFRVIKTIELTVVTSEKLEPYQSVNATLIQLGNKTLLKPDKSALSYLLGQSNGEQPDSGTLRVNWRANQQVAVSKINQKDDGMFDLNFFLDDRYFPFEGTGIVSSWRLEIPQASNPDLVVTSEDVSVLNIEDVLIHIRYTAKSERGNFKKEVEKMLGIK